MAKKNFQNDDEKALIMTKIKPAAENFKEIFRRFLTNKIHEKFIILILKI